MHFFLVFCKEKVRILKFSFNFQIIVLYGIIERELRKKIKDTDLEKYTILSDFTNYFPNSHAN